MTHLDTSFLVDLLRESAAKKPGRAHARLESLDDERLAVSVFVACELHAGAELARDPEEERGRIETLLTALDVVEPDERLPPQYGSILAELRRRGQAIATMDLLIAATARSHDAALVTRDAGDFDRVPGLVVVGY